MSKKGQKALASATVMSLVLTTALTTMPAMAATTVGTPVSGTDRVATSIAIAEKAYANKDWTTSTNAVIASGADDSMVDALAVAPFAYQKKAAILLTDKHNILTDAVITELTARKITNVYLVGAACSDANIAKLAAAKVTVTKYQGKDREATADLINAELEKLGAPKAYAVVDDHAMADALSIAAIAASQNYEIVLSKGNTVAKDLAGKTVYAVGGSGVLSDALVTKLGATRLSQGTTRYGTNAAVLAKTNANFDTVYVTDGTNEHLVDALAGSVLAAQTASPIVLVNTAAGVDSDVTAALTAQAGKVNTVTAIGGAVTTAITDAIKTAATPVVTDLKVDSVSAINSKVLEVTLNKAATAVGSSMFTVNDASGKSIPVVSADFAAYDSTKTTVVVTLGADTTVGTLYTLNFGTSKANFGGRAVDATKPTVSAVKSTDYNQVEIDFSEPVNINGLKATLAEKYGNKNALAVSKIAYVDGDSTKVQLTTADQAGSTLYGVDITGATDFAGNIMDENNTATFVGTLKDTTTKLSPSTAAALGSKSILVKFNTKVDPTAVTAVTNYTVNEAYGSQTKLNVTGARMATTDDEGIATAADAAKAIVLTVDTAMKDSTLYKVAVTGLSTYTGVAVDTSANTVTFVGKAPYSTTMDLSNATITPVSNTKVRVVFDRIMNKDLLVAGNFSIAKVYGDKAALTISGITVVDSKTVDLAVSSMTGDLYKLTVSNLKDVDGNLYDSSKNTKTFVGAAVANKITSVTAALQNDNVTLRLTFDQNVGTTATDVSHYSIDGSIGYPAKASLVSGNPRQVDLTITKTTVGQLYTVTVKGLENSDGVLMDTAGITTKFVGAGLTSTVPSLQAAIATDKNTVKLYFDKDVTDSKIDGVIWDSSTNTLKTGVLTIAGSSTFGTKALESYGEYAHQDTTNKNVLVIRIDAADLVAANTQSTGVFTITGAAGDFATGYNTVQLAPSNTNMSSIEVQSVQPLSTNSIRVYFDQPVEIPNVNFAKVATTAANKNNYGSAELSLASAVATDSTHMAYDFMLSGGTLAANASNWLVINPVVTTAAIHDYTIGTNPGYVSMADEDTTTANIQQYREFAGTTSTAGCVNNISVYMKDKRTMVVYYPEVMKSTGAGTDDVTNKANYTLTDKSGASLVNTTFINDNLTNATYDATTNSVTMVFKADLPGTSNGYGVKFAPTLANALGNKFVTKSDGTQLVLEMAPSSTDAAKVAISNAVYDATAGTLTITLNQGATTHAKIADTTPFIEALADFGITVKESGKDYTIGAGDITSITSSIGATSVGDSSTNYADTIVITLNATAAGKIDGNSIGTVTIGSGATFNGYNGLRADTTSTFQFSVVK